MSKEREMALGELPPLKVPRRERGYERGREVYEQILRGTLRVLIESGASALTMRRVAVASGVQPGHLAYYFKSRQDLLRELLDALVGEYIEALDAIVHREGVTVEQKFEGAVMQIIADIKTKRTTHVFTELWAMSNHDHFVRDRIEELYKRGYSIFDELIAELNPRLTEEDRRGVMLFIRSMLEGTTISAGYGKPWFASLDTLGQLATKSLLAMIPTLDPGEASDLPL
jgi:AcrR family transcriptional regulator